MDCVFCKIIKGEIPSHKVYENQGAFAFLDVSPLSKGHTLIIPKKHYEKIHEMDDDSFCDISMAISIVSKILGAENYNLLQNNGSLAGQAVPHVHFHIIPKTKEYGLKIEWSPMKNADANDLKTLAEKLSRKAGVA